MPSVWVILKGVTPRAEQRTQRSQVGNLIMSSLQNHVSRTLVFSMEYHELDHEGRIKNLPVIVLQSTRKTEFMPNLIDVERVERIVRFSVPTQHTTKNAHLVCNRAFDHPRSPKLRKKTLTIYSQHHTTIVHHVCGVEGAIGRDRHGQTQVRRYDREPLVVIRASARTKVENLSPPPRSGCRTIREARSAAKDSKPKNYIQRTSTIDRKRAAELSFTSVFSPCAEPFAKHDGDQRSPLPPLPPLHETPPAMTSAKDAME